MYTDTLGDDSIVHKYCFGNSPNLMGDLGLSKLRRQNVAAVLGSVKFMLHFSWIRDLMQMLPSSIGARMMPPGVQDMMMFRRGIRTQIDTILARESSFHEIPSVFTHLRDNPNLPASERSAQRLEDEATLIVMAGTYSPMLSLVIAHFHLLANPDIMTRLRTGLAANPLAVTATQLEQLPYISVSSKKHIVCRLASQVKTREYAQMSLSYTLTLTKRTKKKTYTVPPGTSISVSTLLIHTNESIFPDPWKFEPERWTNADEATLARRRRCMLSFMRGPRACVGMHLANANMVVAVAALARWNMRLFETTDQDVAFCHDYHVLCPRLGSKGLRVKVLARR